MIAGGSANGFGLEAANPTPGFNAADINCPAGTTTNLQVLSITTPNEGNWTILFIGAVIVNSLGGTTVELLINGVSQGLMPLPVNGRQQLAGSVLTTAVGPRFSLSSFPFFQLRNSGANAAIAQAGGQYATVMLRTDGPF